LKTLKTLSVLTLLLLHLSSYAQETPSPDPLAQNSIAQDLEYGIKDLSQIIDLYFEQMISVKSTLAISGLKITSPTSKMRPEIVTAINSLEDSKQKIISTLKEFRTAVDSLPKNSPVYENLKFLYDVTLVKAFLPRYDVARKSIFVRMFSSIRPQYADELISRAEALDLFFTDFDSNEPTKDALNSSYRVAELIKTHNAITGRINELRDSNLFQTYPKNIKPMDGNQEAQLYKSLIKGEELLASAPSAPTAPLLEVKKVAEDHFIIVPTCAGLFVL
jgi:hypothetical protein